MFCGSILVQRCSVCAVLVFRTYLRRAQNPSCGVEKEVVLGEKARCKDWTHHICALKSNGDPKSGDLCMGCNCLVHSRSPSCLWGNPPHTSSFGFSQMRLRGREGWECEDGSTEVASPEASLWSMWKKTHYFYGSYTALYVHGLCACHQLVWSTFTQNCQPGISLWPVERRSRNFAPTQNFPCPKTDVEDKKQE